MNSILWPSWKRILFLFIGIYLSLYCLGGQFVTAIIFEPLWSMMTKVLGPLLGAPERLISIQSGSGDGTFEYYKVFSLMILTALISTTSFVTIRSDKTYEFLLGIIYTLIRYFLAYQLIIYGIAKIGYMQFGYPDDIKMDQRLGEFTPMGLLWTFMGYSKAYTVFTGWLEFIPGLLLLFRRTTLLGALMAFGVMLNVMMLNFCYDVPVKLLSSHMVIMSLFLIIPLFNPIYQLFFTDREVERVTVPTFVSESYEKLILVIKALLIPVILLSVYFMIFHGPSRTSGMSNELMLGKYRVVTYEKKGVDSNLIKNESQWVLTSSEGNGRLIVKSNNGRKQWYKIKDGIEGDSIHLSTYDNSHFSFRIEDAQNDTIHLSRKNDYEQVKITLVKDTTRYRLKDAKFRWMQDYPDNR